MLSRTLQVERKRSSCDMRCWDSWIEGKLQVGGSSSASLLAMPRVVTSLSLFGFLAFHVNTHHPRNLASEDLPLQVCSQPRVLFLTSSRFYQCCNFSGPILSNKIPYATLIPNTPCFFNNESANQHACSQYTREQIHNSGLCILLFAAPWSTCSANKTNDIKTLKHACWCMWLIVKPKLYSHPEQISSLYRCTCCARQIRLRMCGAPPLCACLVEVKIP